ncbi:hypothetical protein LBMAG56_36170 [Verrucomicrobiota bacterium]|nr:hypothetical protein LBMAG56_36170 [Verrucomicrobiota bacterium]
MWSSIALAIVAAWILPSRSHAQSSAVGSWTPPQQWIYPCIHASLLPTGKVLYWPDYTGDTPKFWDPITTAVTEAPKAGYNIFCSGNTLDSQGGVVTIGGQLVLLYGLKDNAVFNAFTGTWTRSSRLNYARWYPSATLLPNGDILTVSGLDENSVAVPIPEVYEAAAGRWRALSDAPLTLPWYPRSFVAPNGKVFVATLISRYLDTAGTGNWTVVAKRLVPGRDDYGSAVMYEPGKVVYIGGGDPPVNSCEIIDLNQPSPTWQYTGSMARPRRQHNTTLLPDGKVLATGGSSAYGIDTESGKNLFAEIWDPATGKWTVLAPQQVYRGYHSSALLLPDGRVLSGGGNGHPDSEVFSPPYLFRGARPSITAAPATIGYTDSFTINTPDAADITKVTLTALGSSTHAQNWGQRFISLKFTPTDGGLSVTPPANGNVCPPGYHMLSLINSSGVPSVSKMVRVGGSSPPPPPPPPAGTNSFVQDPGAAGLVAVKFESNHRTVARGGTAWQPVVVAGSSSANAYQALPNAARNVSTAIEANSPQVDFQIDFKKTGTHYLWLRGIGPSGNDDSCHVGVDGTVAPTASNVIGFPASWTWARSRAGGGVATISIPTVGTHVVSVWMREDGLILDKLVLTTDPAYVPTGLGPVETSRGGTNTPPPPPPTTLAYQQDTTADAFVVMNAETFNISTARGGQSWQPVSVVGSAGSSAMQALPNLGRNIGTSIATTAPQMDFVVNFNRSGPHYLWLRGMASDANNDTCHAGLDGAVQATSDKATGFTPAWSWTRKTIDGPAATINVPTVGLHTFTIWMREDGLILDKIILTPNAAYVPTGLGPPPSERR